MISCVRDTVLTPEDDVEHGGNNWHESGSGKAKKEQVTWDEAHQEGGWHDGTTSPRHDGTTARLAAQTECVKIGVERKHHRATTKFYDKKVKLEQEDRYVRPQPFQYLCQTELGLSQLRVFATIRLRRRNELWLLVFWIQRLGADVPKHLLR